MPYSHYLPGALSVVLLSIFLNGCSFVNKIFPDHSEDYKRANSTAQLEVPPEMVTTPRTDSLVVDTGPTRLSDYDAQQQPSTPTGESSVLPVQENVVLKRDRDREWLVLKGAPSAVWPRIREFWLEQGFLIVREDPVTGVIETDWAENRTAIPQGPVRRLIGKVFDSAYSSSLRDKFRTRLERGEEPGTTEVYITHQGMEEELEGDSDQIQTSVWVPRPEDPGLEIEKLKQLAAFLGAEPEQVASLEKLAETAPERANLLKTEGNSATLVVHEDFSRAWRSVGVALDRVGFAVEDRNRSQGIYYVRYRDLERSSQKKSLFSKLFSGSDKGKEARQYQIKLTEDGEDTRTNVLNAAGEPEQSSTALRILNLLYEKLK